MFGRSNKIDMKIQEIILTAFKQDPDTRGVDYVNPEAVRIIKNLCGCSLAEAEVRLADINHKWTNGWKDREKNLPETLLPEIDSIIECARLAAMEKAKIKP